MAGSIITYETRITNGMASIKFQCPNKYHVMTPDKQTNSQTLQRHETVFAAFDNFAPLDRRETNTTQS